ncbi:prepilin-type N-terminal cleavage/methylation domain-containing protein [Candidatus Poribacteria bacterium]
MSLRNEDGFTMLEILVSIMILSIAVIPLMALFAGAPLLHARREQETRAAFLAQRKLEEVKNIIIYDNDFPNGPGEDEYYEATATAFTEAPDTEFKYTVDDPDPDPDPGELKIIVVQVWHDNNGDGVQDAGEQTVTLETKVAKRRET